MSISNYYEHFEIFTYLMFNSNYYLFKVEFKMQLIGSNVLPLL